MLETQRLGEERQVRNAVANIVASVVLGIGGGGARAMDRWPVVNQPCLKLTTYFGERQRAVGDGGGAGFWPTRCWTCSTPGRSRPA